MNLLNDTESVQVYDDSLEAILSYALSLRKFIMLFHTHLRMCLLSYSLALLQLWRKPIVLFDI